MATRHLSKGLGMARLPSGNLALCYWNHHVYYRYINHGKRSILSHWPCSMAKCQGNRFVSWPSEILESVPRPQTSDVWIGTRNLRSPSLSVNQFSSGRFQIFQGSWPLRNILNIMICYIPCYLHLWYTDALFAATRRVGRPPGGWTHWCLEPRWNSHWKPSIGLRSAWSTWSVVYNPEMS